MLLDYGAALQAGRSLVPDFRLQTMQDQQFALEQQQAAMEQQAQQRELDQQAAFQRDFEEAMRAGGSPDAITDLMIRHPQMAEAMTPAFERMEAAQQREELTAAGSIYSRLNAGDTEGAAALLEQRVMADREAGTPDPQDEALLTALRSGDEREVGIARTMIGAQVAALAGAENFRAIYGSAEGTAFQQDYNFIAQMYGQDAADQYAQSRYDPTVVGQPGAPIYRESQITGGARPPVSQRGGDPSGSSAGAVPPPPNLGNEVDFAEYQRVVASMNNPQSAATWAQRNGLVVRVQSVQQARQLPPGTTFVTPDGRTMQVPAQ